MNQERATRLPDCFTGDLPTGLKDDHVCYWKSGATGWWIYLPGAGIGRLTNHMVTEHDDGTITVSPSIGLRKANTGGFARHGFLERGTWREV